MSRKKNRRNRQGAGKRPDRRSAPAAPSITHHDTSRPGNEYDAAAGAKGYYGRIVSALRAAVPGGWASDHYEETLHCTGWNYIAANSIGMQCAAAGVEISRPIDSIDAWSGKTYRKRFDRLHKHSGRERYFQSVRSVKHLARQVDYLAKSHDQDDSEERDILPEDFGLCKLINRPNPSQSGAHLRYEASIQLSQTGTALIVKIPNKFGKAVELYVVPTCLMTPRPPTSEFPYGAYYVSPAATRTNWADDSFVTMVGYQRLAGLTLDMRDLIKISFPHPLWKDEGYSALAACSLWTDASEQIDRARFSQFMNGCDPSMVLEPPEDVNPSDNEIERVLQKMMEFIGTKHTGRVLVTPGGTKATPWSTTPREMAYGEGFDQLRNAIMGGHGVPLIAAGITDGGSYAAFYAALKQFIMLCVQPRLDWIAEELTYQLAEQYGEGLMIRLIAQAIDDPAILEARLATDVTARAITKNEIRQLRGLEPKEDGDVWAGEKETVRVDSTQGDASQSLAGATEAADERSTGISTGQTKPTNPAAHFDSVGNSNVPSIGPFDMGGKALPTDPEAERRLRELESEVTLLREAFDDERQAGRTWREIFDRKTLLNGNGRHKGGGDHDVTGEARDDHGRWTDSGGTVTQAKPRSATPTLAELAARQKPSQQPASGPSERPDMHPARREGKGKEARLVLADGRPAPEHIKPSMVPPQWTDVHVSTDPKADVLVRARDAKGRLKTVYSDNFTMRQAANKFARVNELVSKRHEISEQNQKNRKSDDPKIREAADCLWLIEEQATRPGSDSDTKAKVKAYGATTLRAEHVEQDEDGAVRLHFIGKEGIEHNHRIRNPELAKMLVSRKQTADKRGGKLFATSDTALRDYTRSLDGGEFTPKDFRTAKATVLAADEIKRLGGCCRDKKEYKAAVKQVATAVSSVLGNRPQQAVESYINPVVWSAWQCPDCGTGK